MPRARTKRGKLRQLENWLREHFKTPYAVTVTVKPMPSAVSNERVLGLCYREGKRLYITVEARVPYFAQVDVLIHEWAHAATTRHSHLEDLRDEHDAEWGLLYARILHELFDLDRWDEVDDQDKGAWK